VVLGDELQGLSGLGSIKAGNRKGRREKMQKVHKLKQSAIQRSSSSTKSTPNKFIVKAATLCDWTLSELCQRCVYYIFQTKAPPAFIETERADHVASLGVYIKSSDQWWGGTWIEYSGLADWHVNQYVRKLKPKPNDFRSLPVLTNRSRGRNGRDDPSTRRWLLGPFQGSLISVVA